MAKMCYSTALFFTFTTTRRYAMDEIIELIQSIERLTHRMKNRTADPDDLVKAVLDKEGTPGRGHSYDAYLSKVITDLVDETCRAYTDLTSERSGPVNDDRLFNAMKDLRSLTYNYDIDATFFDGISPDKTS